MQDMVAYHKSSHIIMYISTLGSHILHVFFLFCIRNLVGLTTAFSISNKTCCDVNVSDSVFLMCSTCTLTYVSSEHSWVRS